MRPSCFESPSCDALEFIVVEKLSLGLGNKLGNNRA